jgi:hypothetical protein
MYLAKYFYPLDASRLWLLTLNFNNMSCFLQMDMFSHAMVILQLEMESKFGLEEVSEKATGVLYLDSLF